MHEHFVQMILNERSTLWHITWSTRLWMSCYFLNKVIVSSVGLHT